MNEHDCESTLKINARSKPPMLTVFELQILQEFHEFILQQAVNEDLQAFKLELANRVIKCKDNFASNGLHEQIQSLHMDDVQIFFTAVLDKATEIFTKNNVPEQEAYAVAERRHKQAISDAAMRAEGHHISFSRSYLAAFKVNHGHPMLELACLMHQLKLKLNK